MKTSRLRDLTTLISSGSTPKGGNKTYLDEGPVMFVRSQNVRMNALDLSDVKYIRPEVHAEMKRTHVERNDVLLNITGASIGRVATFDLTDQLANVNQHVCIVRPKKEKLYPPYLTSYLSTPEFQAEIDRLQRGGTRQALTFSQIAEFEIPLPPLPEQKRIAAILDKADEIRKKRAEAIKLTEELLRSAFLEMFGDPVTNPKGWEVKSLESLAEIGSGITKGRKLKGNPVSEVPYMRVANVQDGHIDLSEIKTIAITSAEAERFALRPGDVLLTEGGDPDKLGRGAVWRGEIEPCIHQNHIFKVRCSSKASVPEYLSALIGSDYGKQYFLKAAKQTTGIATINKTQLSAFPVILPPPPLQHAYAKTVVQVAQLTHRLGEELKKAESLGEALTQRAFRGEL